MKKNVAGQKVGAQLVSATDGAAFTSTVTIYVTKDAGTQAIGSVGSGVCVHEGNGYHTYSPSQAETNGDLIAFTFVGTGAVPVTVQVAHASEVWDVDYSLHKIAGTFGKLMDILRKSNTVIEGTILASPTPTTTTFRISGADYPTGALEHAVLWMSTGTSAEQNSPILTTVNNGDGTLTITLEESLVTAPIAGDVVLIDPTSHVHAIVDIVSGVWSALTSGFNVSGSAGTVLKALDSMLEFVGGLWRWKATSLTQAPSGTSTVTVLPAIGVAAGRGDRTTLVAYVAETITTSITVYQADGITAYNLTGKTLAVIFENPKTGDDVAVVASGSITISGTDSNVVSFAYPSAATAAQRELTWTMRDASAPKTVYLRGVLEVRAAATVD
jgi:hypothetical protein